MTVKCVCGAIGTADVEEDADPALVSERDLRLALERDGWRKIGEGWICPFCNRVGRAYHDAPESMKRKKEP